MLISTGWRTDIIQYYTPWLIRRFREGFVDVRNPFVPDEVTRYSLDPRVVDAVLFCSKNYEPILGKLPEITERFRCFFWYTITGYGPDIEPHVPDVTQSIETLKKLSRLVGKSRIAWRYDPVMVYREYSLDFHRRMFSFMAREIAPYVARVVFSFVVPYKKVQAHMPDLVPPGMRQKEELARMLGEIARENALPIQICGESGDWREYGILGSGCVSPDLLGSALGLTFRKVSRKGNRQGCACMESRDIGAYDSCPNGCRYCYATQNPEEARENWLYNHDPTSTMLIGHYDPKIDHLHEAYQESIVSDRGFVQGTLF